MRVLTHVNVLEHIFHSQYVYSYSEYGYMDSPIGCVCVCVLFGIQFSSSLSSSYSCSFALFFLLPLTQTLFRYIASSHRKLNANDEHIGTKNKRLRDEEGGRDSESGPNTLEHIKHIWENSKRKNNDLKFNRWARRE